MAHQDELDEAPGYDAEMEEIFSGLHNSDNNDRYEPTKERVAAPFESENLGIDEEVKITKKRKPIAKLDSSRLVSTAGVPKLRRISKTKLKFRGKGHEFSDVALMLRMYQLWLDDLYPRAKFSDGLQIIEKLGHTKEMQMLRKQWIDEDKPKPSDQAEIEIHPDNSSASGPLQQQVSGNEIDEQVSATSCRVNETSSQSGLNTKNTSRQSPHAAFPEQPEDDEMDALLAEEIPQDSIFGTGQQANISRMEHSVADEYEDDEDALREMGMIEQF